MVSHKKGKESPPGSPWPFPQHMGNSSSELVYLSAKAFKFHANMQSKCDILQKNKRRYKKILFPPKINIEHPTEELTILKDVFISVRDNIVCPDLPETDQDEYCKKINK